MIRPLAQISQLIPDLVVYRPHDVGRPGNVIFHFQKRVEKISLLCVVDGQIADL